MKGARMGGWEEGGRDGLVEEKLRERKRVECERERHMEWGEKERFGCAETETGSTAGRGSSGEVDGSKREAQLVPHNG